MPCLPFLQARRRFLRVSSSFYDAQVLLATDAGQLLALDKRLFDPRRPLVAPNKMTQADREEGLLPYMPSTGGIQPLSAISHRNSLARPAGIAATPTVLESTSLVFAFGLDLFCTRVAPAKVPRGHHPVP